MGDKTGIEWTEATWNPIVGCTAVSPGCDHCYAARHASGRLKHLPLYAGLAERGVFNGTVRLVPERLDQPLRWRRPRRIFVNSMSDLFHDGVPDEYIAKVFAVMAAAPHHAFQVLTKRHGRMRSLLNNPDWRMSVFARESVLDLGGPARPLPTWPLSNVWLGVSVEDQKWADIRIPALLDTPAAVRWISAEPLLGPIDLTWCGGINALAPDWSGAMGAPHPLLNWVVAGGESGPGARPMHPEWARGLRDQCAAAEVPVPFLFKQWGEWAPNGYRGIGQFAGRERLVGPELDDMGHREVIERVGKKAAGRELDGRIWDEYPQAVSHA